MNDYTLLPPTDVQAPAYTFAWSPARGWIDNVAELSEAHLEGELTLEVDDDGVVVGVEGECPLAVAMRLDRMLLELQRFHARLAERVSDLGDKAEARDTDEGMELVGIKARLRRLEEERG